MKLPKLHWLAWLALAVYVFFAWLDKSLGGTWSSALLWPLNRFKKMDTRPLKVAP